MPSYTYRCVSCHNEHPVFHQMNDAPIVKCNVCHGKTTRQFGSGAGIIFKGDGFYATQKRKDSEQITVHDKKAGTKRRMK
jgi:putative FmdB family regulatory protein